MGVGFRFVPMDKKDNSHNLYLSLLKASVKMNDEIASGWLNHRSQLLESEWKTYVVLGKESDDSVFHS